MKKLLLLPVIAYFFAACSTDSFDDATQDQGTVFNTEKGVAPCFSVTEGYVTVNAAAGLNNPDINFSLGITPGTYTRHKSYQLTLYLQPIADCEDMTTAIGEPLVYSSVASNIDTVIPTITLKPANLPSSCYIWKMTISAQASFSLQACSNSTPWYDAPLF